MPASGRAGPPEISRARRFLLLELPGWAILAVSVAYASSAGNGRITVALQVVLISAALAWFGGGRLPSLATTSLLFGWAAGAMAVFNLLALASIGVFLLPVTGFVLVVLALLLGPRGPRPIALAAAGFGLAGAVELVLVGLLNRPN